MTTKSSPWGRWTTEQPVQELASTRHPLRQHANIYRGGLVVASLLLWVPG